MKQLPHPNFRFTIIVAMIGVLACSRVDQPQRDDVQQAGIAAKQFAAKQSTSPRLKSLRYAGTVQDLAGDDVCACMQVCNSKGQNCTPCSCSPANCGSC